MLTAPYTVVEPGRWTWQDASGHGWPYAKYTTTLIPHKNWIKKLLVELKKNYDMVPDLFIFILETV